MKFRPVRELLHESMSEMVELSNMDELAKHLNADKSKVRITPYTYDDRIGWDTYLVTVNGVPFGYTDGGVDE